MSAIGDGLGRVLNVVYTSSGLNIPLTRATCVTFVCVDAGSGDQTATITETDSRGVLGEQAIGAGKAGGTAGLVFRPFNGPDVGGTWTANAEHAAGVITNGGGATNDTLVFTVKAEQLTPGYDQVQVTVNEGTCVAIIHDLLVQRKPSNLTSSLVA